MSALRYESAADGLLVVAAEGSVLVVDDGARPVEVASLWAALQGRDAVADAMAALTTGGLAATPAFALLVPVDGEGARLVVRGRLVAEVVSVDGGASTIDASTVVTWAEHLLTDAVSVTVRSVSTASPSADAAMLPLASGAVRAAAVSLDLVPVDADRAAAAVVDRTVVVPHLQRDAAPAPAATAPAAAAPVVAAPVAVAAPPAPPAAPPIAAPTSGTSSSSDDLHSTRAPEHTIIPSALEAAEETAVVPPAPSAPAAPDAGDHDGLTVVASDLAALRAAAAESAPAAASGPRYVLDISSGGSAALDGSIIVGRAPSTSRVSDGRIPQLVGLPGADDISRNHVRFDLEGDSVVVTDLHSRNGTVLRAPGATPRQLRAGESSVVLGGTVVDLGGITLTVREG
ncbi:FHA domain-containing protein [Microcella daejeonensis]|uniref:FHA domain-containing protein n=1 Tax=Microcella daejeonensis TaxID=2994971 RepID=A0A9E8SBM3_9MICO|nr:FHA domain-containing protein [Microcella daejeonensis]WAB81712.1 FHA domain-containing protein [Microcella daejeonensis]